MSSDGQRRSSIVVDGVTKEYRIGALQRQDRTLSEVVVGALTRPFRRSDATKETVTALSDVSLEIASDEVVGLIGRNGSGKTTLLKLLSKITYPTRGTVTVHGRVAPLVEVGTGFHQELTGRENVFLNGSILGLKRREIAERFDQIVAFSGVDRFIDTPIKRYSTGMRLRLGFAVAAHLFPDVLLVDEVLAVGDAEFQAKCLNTLAEVGERGRTVVFVSHNLEAVEQLCTRTIWLDRGKVREDGDSRTVIANYLREFSDAHRAAVDLTAMPHRAGTGEAKFTKVEFLDTDGRPNDLIHGGDTLVLRLHYDVETPVRRPHFGVSIATEFGALVAHPNTWTDGHDIEVLEPGSGAIDLRIERLPLMPGRYPITLWVNRHSDSSAIDWVEHGATLAVHTPNHIDASRILERRAGAVFFDSHWSVPDS